MYIYIYIYILEFSSHRVMRNSVVMVTRGITKESGKEGREKRVGDDKLKMKKKKKEINSRQKLKEKTGEINKQINNQTKSV